MKAVSTEGAMACTYRGEHRTSFGPLYTVYLDSLYRKIFEQQTPTQGDT